MRKVLMYLWKRAKTFDIILLIGPAIKNPVMLAKKTVCPITDKKPLKLIGPKRKFFCTIISYNTACEELVGKPNNNNGSMIANAAELLLDSAAIKQSSWSFFNFFCRLWVMLLTTSTPMPGMNPSMNPKTL